MSTRITSVVFFLTVGLVFCAAHAAVVETDQSNSTDASGFVGNISSSDLINTGRPSLLGVSYSGHDSGNHSMFPGVNDGSYNLGGVDGTNVYLGQTNSGYSSITNTGAVPRTATYSLDTVSHPLGYDITQINTFAGFGGSPPTAEYADQRYTVYVSFVGSPSTFTLLKDVTFYPFFPFATGPGLSSAPSSSEVSLTDSSGVIASGVAAIQFSFLFTYDNTDKTGVNHSTNKSVVGFEDGQLIQEADVFGSPTVAPVPEPASIGLVALAAVPALMRRRRSHRAV